MAWEANGLTARHVSLNSPAALHSERLRCSGRGQHGGNEQCRWRDWARAIYGGWWSRAWL